MSGRVRSPSDVPWRFTRDAAAYVGLGENAFRAAVKRGEIAQISDAGHPRYLLSDLQMYLESRRRAPEVKGEERQRRRRAGVIQLPDGINKITGRRYGSAAR